MAKKRKTKEIMTISQLEAKNAQEPYFGKGIQLAGGFDLGAKAALDSRATVKTISERDAHVTGNRAYEGMLVYVEADQKTYQLVNNAWKVFGFDAQQFEASVEDVLTSTNTNTALSANQGRILNEKITAQGETITEINTTVTEINETVTKIEESIEGLGSDLTDGLTALDNRVTVVEGDLATAKTDIESLKSTSSKNAQEIAELEEALEAEVERAAQEEARLDAKIDSEVGDLQAADTALNAAIVAVEAKADKNASDLANEITARTEADAALEAKVAANTTAIEKEVADRTSEIARVEGLITGANNELTAKVEALEAKDAELEARISTEESNRISEDKKLSDAITAVDGKVESLQQELESIELTWERVNNKPFETTGNTLKVSGDGTLDVKVDGQTIVEKSDGSLEVKDGIFAAAGHNHDSEYASKDHELNTEIHLTATEKANVAKIPAMETDISALKSTVGAASQHHIVMTVGEMQNLENTNHGDICHVIETKKTYILDKKDIDGDLVNPEWIELADFNSLVSVDWSIINNKPFTTVGEGLEVVGDAVKVVADGSTVEIKDGKVSVKEGVFADANHTHTVTFEEIVNKPTVFSKNCASTEWVEEDELVALTVNHAKASTNLIVKVIGADNIERLVAVEYMDENTIKVWSDVKENVTVTVFSYDFTNPSTHAAIAGLVYAGQAVCGMM